MCQSTQLCERESGHIYKTHMNGLQCILCRMFPQEVLETNRLSFRNKRIQKFNLTSDTRTKTSKFICQTRKRKKLTLNNDALYFSLSFKIELKLSFDICFETMIIKLNEIFK